MLADEEEDEVSAAGPVDDVDASLGSMLCCERICLSGDRKGFESLGREGIGRLRLGAGGSSTVVVGVSEALLGVWLVGVEASSGHGEDEEVDLEGEDVESILAMSNLCDCNEMNGRLSHSSAAAVEGVAWLTKT